MAAGIGAALSGPRSFVASRPAPAGVAWNVSTRMPRAIRQIRAARQFRRAVPEGNRANRLRLQSDLRLFMRRQSLDERAGGDYPIESDLPSLPPKRFNPGRHNRFSEWPRPKRGISNSGPGGRL